MKSRQGYYWKASSGPFPLSPSLNCPVSEERLPPKAFIYLPPVLKEDFEAVAREDVHPAWSKIQRRGPHFIIATTSLEDVEEVADWARAAIMEPDISRPLTKARRQAFQTVVKRAERWAVLEPVGCHFMAVAWREQKAYKQR